MFPLEPRWRKSSLSCSLLGERERKNTHAIGGPVQTTREGGGRVDKGFQRSAFTTIRVSLFLRAAGALFKHLLTPRCRFVSDGADLFV